MIKPWWPTNPPIYDIHKSYSDNLKEGPCFNHPLPKRVWPDKSQWIDFLGHPVASRLGVAAGPLLDSRWTTLAANLGFDLITYKTIRSEAHPCHPLPNCGYVNFNKPFEPDHIPSKTVLAQKIPEHLSEISITNSFGMPSQSPEVLQKDLPKAIKNLHPGQVLIASIVGTPKKEISFVEDFKKVALFAKSCGAPIIEANFSCPNVVSKEGSLFLDPKQTYEIAHALTRALQGTPLILKLGVFPNFKLMKEVFIAAAKAKVRAISGINTISMEVLDQDQKPALGPNRLRSGICGSAIFEVALNFMEEAHRINTTEKLGLTLIGVGGIMKPQDIETFRTKGADFVQTATGMMWDPLLAERYHKFYLQAH